ncbi:Folate transporter 1 [Diplonema papillatum]|nr:Folate transporter 1 [Diplonema papillatum]
MSDDESEFAPLHVPDEDAPPDCGPAELPWWDALRAEWRTVLALCSVPFFINCQPSEPYLTKYLLESKNLTESQVECCVWPYDTYGAFLVLFPLGFATEILGYRAVILFGLLCRQATRLLLLYAEGLSAMAFMQVTYACATGANTIYYSYAFVACPPRVAPVAVALINASYSVGNVLGSVLSEAIAGHVTLKALFYQSWAFSSVGLGCFLLFSPKPVVDMPSSLYSIIRKDGFAAATKELRDLYAASKNIRLWSFWWVFGYSAAFIVGNYSQNQFYDLDSDGAFGYAEAIYEAAAAVGGVLPALAAGWVRGWSAEVIVVVSLALVVPLYLSTRASTFYESVLLNAAASGLFSYQLSAAEITISHVLGRAESHRYAVVFAFNSFLGLGLGVAVQKVLSHYRAPTRWYYYACMAQLGAGSVAVLLYTCLSASRPCSEPTHDDAATPVSDSAGSVSLSGPLHASDESDPIAGPIQRC